MRRTWLGLHARCSERHSWKIVQVLCLSVLRRIGVLNRSFSFTLSRSEIVTFITLNVIKTPSSMTYTSPVQQSRTNTGKDPRRPHQRWLRLAEFASCEQEMSDVPIRENATMERPKASSIVIKYSRLDVTANQTVF